MAAIRSRDTLPERLLRSALFAGGLRFRLHVRSMPGSPDLVFPRFRAAVFVHGCFWHRHPECRFAAVPKNNAGFWAEKFAANQRRDLIARQRLTELGWRVAVVWECAIRESPQRAAHELGTWLRAGRFSEVDIGGVDVRPAP
jgi:DNA mismatch endonuclease, patch repair protein